MMCSDERNTTHFVTCVCTLYDFISYTMYCFSNEFNQHTHSRSLTLSLTLSLSLFTHVHLQMPMTSSLHHWIILWAGLHLQIIVSKFLIQEVYTQNSYPYALQSYTTTKGSTILIILFKGIMLYNLVCSRFYPFTSYN